MEHGVFRAFERKVKGGTRGGLVETTHYTKCKSYDELKTQERVRLILGVLGDNEMTAREIAFAAGFSDMNAVRPRLTELLGCGVIETTGTKCDPLTHKMVSVYKRVI